MYVKLIDETLNIANMPDDEAIANGYKLAVFAEKPSTETGYHAESAWTETDTEYVQSWTVVEDVYDDSISVDEALEILLGGAS